MSMSNTGNGLTVSESNIVSCTLTNNPSNSRPAIYFQKYGSSTVINFAVFRCSVKNAKSLRGYQGKFSSIHYENGKEETGSTTINGLITDLDYDDVNYNYLKITITGTNKYKETAENTHDIRQLNLGECAGDEIAPAMIEPTLTETLHPTVTETPFPTVTETPFPTVTETPFPSVSETPFPTVTETPFPTVTETPFPSFSETPKPIVTETPFPTITETPNPTLTETPFPSGTPVPIITTIVATPMPTEIPTPLPTVTSTEMPSQTPQPTQSLSQTPTPIPPKTVQTTQPPTVSQSRSCFFSMSNFFTESQFFVGSFEHQKSKRMIN